MVVAIGGAEMTINVEDHHILHRGKWSHGLSSSAAVVTSYHNLFQFQEYIFES